MSKRKLSRFTAAIVVLVMVFSTLAPVSVIAQDVINNTQEEAITHNCYGFEGEYDFSIEEEPIFETGELQMSLSHVVGAVGSYVDVVLNIDQNQSGVFLMILALEYDATRLEMVSVTRTPLAAQFLPPISPSSLMFEVQNLGVNMNGTGALATIRFRILAGASGVIPIGLRDDGGTHRFGPGFTVFPVTTAFSAGSVSVGTGNVGTLPMPAVRPMVVAGRIFSVALRNDGTVWSWGSNSSGSLGRGNTTNSNTAVPVQGLTDAVAIAGGHALHALALRQNGTVVAWGRNFNGELGDGTTTQRNSPVPVQNLTNVIAIAVGGNISTNGHSLALRNDGTVWAWGVNNAGQLGNATTIQSTVPVQVQNLNNVIAIAAGSQYSLALRNDGTVWAWGMNTSGQLGNGTNVSSTTPVQVQGINNVTAISARSDHSMALRNDGTVWTWGNNGSGRLGNGLTTNSNIPVQALGLSNMTSVSAGTSNSFAIRNDGTTWAWGNTPLGNGGTGSTVPIQINNLNNVTMISSRSTHNLAIRDDGYVLAWHCNCTGELGDGTTTTRMTPVRAVTGQAPDITGSGFLNLGSGGDAFIYVQPVASTVFTGGQLRVPINIRNNPGLGSYDIVARIAPVLMPHINNISVEFGSVTTGFMNEANLNYRPNSIRIGGANPMMSRANGTIAYLVLDISHRAPQGIFPVELEVRRLSTVVNNLPSPISPVTVVDGYIEILGAMLGDVDGDGFITVDDAQMVLLYLAGLITLAPWQRIAADVNMDGVIDVVDANIILRIAIELQRGPGFVSVIRVGSFGNVGLGEEEADVLEDVYVPAPMEHVPTGASIITVPIAVQDNAGFSGFDVTLNYDSNMLTPIGFTRGAAWPSLTVFNANTTGDYAKLVGIAANNVMANGNLAYVVFEATGTVTNVANYVTLDVVTLSHVYNNDVERVTDYHVANTSIVFGPETPITLRDALIAEIARAEARVQANYTPASWAQVLRTLPTARAVRDNVNATDAQITLITSNLAAAIDALVEVQVTPGFNVDALLFEIARAEARVQANYTPASWAQVLRALPAARAARDNPNATQAQVDLATINLRDAIDSLVVR